jgi:hypothetical protein
LIVFLDALDLSLVDYFNIEITQAVVNLFEILWGDDFLW